MGLDLTINNDTYNLRPFIADLRIRQKIIYKLCGSIGHKADACIIHDPKFLPPSLIRNTNQLNALHGYKPNNTPIDCNSQPPADNFKYRTYPPKTSTVVSDIIGRLNHHAIDNGDVEVHPSEFPV